MRYAPRSGHHIFQPSFKFDMTVLSSLFLFAAVLSSISGESQAQLQPESAQTAPASAISRPPSPVGEAGLASAVIKKGPAQAQAGRTMMSKDCTFAGSEPPHGALVVVTRAEVCTFGGQTSWGYEVWYGKDVHWTSEEALLFIGSVKAQGVRERNDALVNQQKESWRLSADAFRDVHEKEAAEVLEKSSSQGIILFDSGIYDVSEHTDGTGYRVRFLNTSKKTLKYATFTLIGRNAVEDVVRDPVFRRTQVTLKGVGPVEPNTFAEYSVDYLWHTDLVESFDIRSVKLDYMDGTSRTVTNTKNLRANRSLAETLAY